MKQTAQSCSLVAALIATVVFAAAFTLPGGINDEGTPVFVNRPLFIIYAICNALSLFSSSASVLMFLSILTSRYAEHDFLKSLPIKLMVGLTGLFVSIVTMMIALTVTFFVTFRKLEKMKWIPIPIALSAAVPVALFAFQQYPLWKDIYIALLIDHCICLNQQNLSFFLLTQLESQGVWQLAVSSLDVGCLFDQLK